MWSWLSVYFRLALIIMLLGLCFTRLWIFLNSVKYVVCGLVLLALWYFWLLYYDRKTQSSLKFLWFCFKTVFFVPHQQKRHFFYKYFLFYNSPKFMKFLEQSCFYVLSLEQLPVHKHVPLPLWRHPTEQLILHKCPDWPAASRSGYGLDTNSLRAKNGQSYMWHAGGP